MIDPNDKAVLDAVIEHHMQALSDEDKHGMLMEFFDCIRDYVTEEGTPDEMALSQAVYASHLFIRIFDDLYEKAEQIVLTQEHLQNCFDK